MKKYLLLMITLFSFHAYAEIKTGPQIEKLYPVAFIMMLRMDFTLNSSKALCLVVVMKREGDSVNLTLITRSFIHFYLR